MAWKDVYVKGKEFGNTLGDVYKTCVEEIGNEKKKDIYIPLENGHFIAKRNVFDKETLILELENPSDEFKDIIYESIVDMIYSDSSGWRDASKCNFFFTCEKKLKDKEQTPFKVKFHNPRWIVIKEKKGRLTTVSMDATVLFPDLITKEKPKELEGTPYQYREGIDLEKCKIASITAHEAKKQGFNATRKKHTCFSQVCIPTKTLNKGEIIEILKQNEAMNFYIEEGDYLDVSKFRVKSWSTLLNLTPYSFEIESNIRDSLANLFLSSKSNLSNLIKKANIKIDPEAIVTYKTPYESLISKGAKKAGDGLITGFGFVYDHIFAPPFSKGINLLKNGYRKYVETKEQKRKRERDAIILALKDENVVSGDNCYLQLNPACILKSHELDSIEKDE